MLQQLDLVIALGMFCIVTLFSPGPNNIMLMTSGLNFGFRQTLPHMLGVAFGFPIMAFAVGMGLGVIFETYPALYTILRYAGAAYLTYLAYRIATAAPVDTSKKAQGHPMTFIQALAFQWINPKAWVMAISAVTTYSVLAGFPYNMMIIAGFYMVLGTMSAATWTGFGTLMQRLLKNPKLTRIFNITMAILLIASLYPIFVE